MVRFGDPRALFVLDNIHLDEGWPNDWRWLGGNWSLQSAHDFCLWGESCAPGAAPYRRSRHPYSATEGAPAQVRGVYHAWSRKTDSATIAEPPPSLDRWVMTFGGDPTSTDTRPT